MNNRARMAIAVSSGFLIMSEGGLGIRYADAAPASAKTQKVRALPIAVKTVEDRQVTSILSQYKNKVVVANFWATWCGPCREEFPELVKLYRKYRKQGLVVIGFSIDDLEALDQVKKFLQEQQADFPAYLVDIKDQEKLIDSVDKDWPGSIPATFIYDKKGKLTKRLIGAQELDDLEKEIKPILNSR